MKRKQFFQSLGVTLLATPLFSFKNKSIEKDCLDFDLSHYTFPHHQLVLGNYKHPNYNVYKINSEIKEGNIFYYKTLDMNDNLVAESWSIISKDYQQSHTKHYSQKRVTKTHKNFITEINREISLPLN